ncbi:MAG: bifunctional (p)ppGpp synthetase/guanosine-3',5'-bis(diphosphate) 3'-pyrophosphohydrolase [Gammaproteobacteria bacterium]|nr:MAG: bifunctional (p)ppGpp synthetase/guanosine-3',5'-bis(diphosphate) 3'-pyrophosphohydrolase [Gammaproteobacteria bacterium]
MSELVSRAIRFATEAHERIDHLRKYSNLSYTVHLDQVAKITETVTDDEEMIAAAWLHDVVEDTPATLEDIEREFGVSVAILVRELTDISKPSDGNRAERKALDKTHLAQASARAQTIKLADLIDNCIDITKHDPRFARVYVKEMEALLRVLVNADEGLMSRARRTMEKSNAQLGKLQIDTENIDIPADELVFDSHFRQQYNDIFSAKDIAEPLLSFDATTSVEKIREIFKQQQQQVATVLVEGKVMGFTTSDLLDTSDNDEILKRIFSSDQVLSGDAGFAEVVHVLTRHDYCFVRLLGQVHGVISRDDMNKPYVRMWLFGIITLMEKHITELVRTHFDHDKWHGLIPEARLKLAENLQHERKQINQHCELIDCLQLADKGLILIKDTELLSKLGFNSKNSAKKVLKQFQSLRNNLAHAQDISTYDWAQIARLSMRMLE